MIIESSLEDSFDVGSWPKKSTQKPDLFLPPFIYTIPKIEFCVRGPPGLSMVKPKTLNKNVWKSDKSWEPEKIWKFENLKILIQNSKIKMAQDDPREMLNYFCFHV